MTRLNEQNPHWCGDTCCILLVPGLPVPTGTNDDCQCLSDSMDPDDYTRVRKGIRWLADRVAELNAPRGYEGVTEAGIDLDPDETGF